MKTNNTKNDVNLITRNQFENTNKDSEVITTYNTLRGETSIQLNSNINMQKNDFIKGVPMVQMKNQMNDTQQNILGTNESLLRQGHTNKPPVLFKNYQQQSKDVVQNSVLSGITSI